MKTVIGVWLLIPVALAGCRSDAPGGINNMDAGMDQSVKLERPDAYCAPDAAGGGQCPLNFCGQAKVGFPSNQFPQSGADSLCGVRTCKVGPELSTGDGFQLVCVDPNAAGLAFGAACNPDPAQGMRCADDSLCIAAPDFQTGPRFCSTMCRNDDDCPRQARCLEHPAPALTDGRIPVIGMCVPESKIGGTVCVRESDCPAAQGCILYGGRSSLRICKTRGTKSLGTACTAASECRSGECYDRDFHVSGGQNRAFCSGACNVNSDCGPDQGCVRLVVGNNGTSGDPLDDLVVGYCRTLFVPLATAGCQSNAGCAALQNGSDACDIAHGLCFKSTAVPGSACTMETDCPIGAECSVGPRFLGGYCQTFGCDPAATSGVNLCAGNSVCAQRGGPDEPLSACYEKCTPGDGGATCSRASAGYRCESVAPGTPPSACLVATGS